MIETTNETTFTRVKVLNWKRYQPTTRKRGTTSGTGGETTDGTTNGTTGGTTGGTHQKKDKKDKNEKKVEGADAPGSTAASSFESPVARQRRLMVEQVQREMDDKKRKSEPLK